MNWIKEHPYEAAGIVLGLGLLFILLRSSGSSGGTQVVQAGPSDNVQIAGLQTSAQLQVAQLSAQLEAQKSANTLTSTQDTLAAELAATQTNAQATYANNVLAAQVQGAGIAAQKDIADLTLTSQVQQAHDTLAAATQQNADTLAAQASISNEAQRTNQLGITANQAEYLANLDTAQKEQAATIAASEQLYQTNSDTQLGLAKIAADVTGHQTDAQLAAVKDYNSSALAAYQSGLPIEAQAEHEQQNNINTAILAEAGYRQNLVNLVGLGKNISGLPQVGLTTQNVEAAQPGNSTGGVLSGIGALFRGLGQGAAAVGLGV